MWRTCERPGCSNEFEAKPRGKSTKRFCSPVCRNANTQLTRESRADYLRRWRRENPEKYQASYQPGLVSPERLEQKRQAAKRYYRKNRRAKIAAAVAYVRNNPEQHKAYQRKVDRERQRKKTMEAIQEVVAKIQGNTP